MINKKLISSLALIAATATVAKADCPTSGFYVGANVNVNFNEARMKVDKDKIKATAEGTVKALVEKITKAMEAANSNKAKVEQIKPTLITAIAKALELDATNNNFVGLQAIQHQGATTGSVNALLGAVDIVAGSAWKAAMNLIKANDSSFSSNNAANTLINAATDYKSIIEKGVSKLIEDNKVGELVTIIANADIANFLINNIANVNPGGNANPTPVPGTAANITALYDKTNNKGTYVEYNKAVTEYTTAYSVATDIAQTYVNAVASSTDTSVLKAIYSDVASKKINDPETLAKNITELSVGAAEKEFEELGINEKSRVSKRATGFGIELVGGYEHRVNDFMLGIDFVLGFDIGGKVKIKDKKAEKGTNGVTVKKQYSIGLMPVIKYFATPEFGIYVTAGGSLCKVKVDTSHMMHIFDHLNVYNKMADSFNKTPGLTDADKISIKVQEQEQAKVFKAHSKTKLIAAIGGGMSYEISPGVTFILGYEFSPNTKVLDITKGGAEVKLSSHKIKTGIRVRV